MSYLFCVPVAADEKKRRKPLGAEEKIYLITQIAGSG